MSDINTTSTAIEAFLATYRGVGKLAPVESHARPSGDDADVIKVWIDLGPAGAAADTDAWGKACEAAIRAGVDVGAFRIEVRVESGA
jgi:hypothetical protein